MRSLRDGGRKEGENTGNVTLGFVTNDGDDYDVALLADEGEVHSKEWIIDSRCSFHICREKRNFLSLE